ncbi:GNAT family N-acetyltransferase [Erwinia persicina]|uniref:GNAT family N-acetyltransferase n=1 Tax=Erwinia persicina TaxID=55211 RepID=UPI0017831B23|nr:GNAT family N-acetyltransferase [Erwinia persicina]MBD8162758.1 GNAT family N-acetyltransferase [Erwinia persicina]MBD8214599.1 GNAT family N-acetyltransferase [Erwinia persicina]
MMPTELVTIQRYRAKYQPGVVGLILPIQNQEFGIAITAEQQPDLSDIEHFYQQGTGDFWLAQIDDRVVGCIGLKDIGQQQTALRKMFVAAPYRGREWGVASALLNTLMMHARDRGVVDIFLGTTAKFLAAHRFYEKNGFQAIPPADLPARFPLMAVDTRFYRFSFQGHV